MHGSHLTYFWSLFIYFLFIYFLFIYSFLIYIFIMGESNLSGNAYKLICEYVLHINVYDIIVLAL
jgi:hypothetical protein